MNRDKDRPIISLHEEDYPVSFKLHVTDESIAALKYAVSALSYIRESQPYACLHIGMVHYPRVRTVKEMLVSCKAFIEAIPDVFSGAQVFLSVASVEGEVKDDSIHAHVAILSSLPVSEHAAFHRLLENYWQRLSMGEGTYTDIREVYYRQATDLNLTQLASDEAIKEMIKEISFSTKSGFEPFEARISSEPTLFMKFSPLKRRKK